MEGRVEVRDGIDVEDVAEDGPTSFDTSVIESVLDRWVLRGREEEGK